MPNGHPAFLLRKKEGTPPKGGVPLGKRGEYRKPISIHTTHTGGDQVISSAMWACSVSTHTAHAGGDRYGYARRRDLGVSTHTAHAGGDQLAQMMPRC